MTDIVGRLRDMRICEGVAGLRIEAADEIERLRAALDMQHDQHVHVWRAHHLLRAQLIASAAKAR